MSGKGPLSPPGLRITVVRTRPADAGTLPRAGVSRVGSTSLIVASSTWYGGCGTAAVLAGVEAGAVVGAWSVRAEPVRSARHA